MKIPIYNINVKLSDLVVCNVFTRSYEAYCIFRPNGQEIEVRMKYNTYNVENEQDLEKIEIEYFNSGYYKKLTNNNLMYLI